MNGILDYGEKQLVLYTKGRFQKTELCADIKCIMAEYYGSEVQHYSLFDVYKYLLSIFFKLDKAGYISIGAEGLMKELFKWDTTIDLKYAIEKLCGQISIVRVAGLNLGESDPSYQPTKKGSARV